MDENQTIDPIQAAAEKQLAAWEAEEKTLEQQPTDAKVTDAKPSVDRTTDNGEVKSTPEPLKTGIPSDAEKTEIETAKTEAEKEGKELDLDDKGTPKRDAQGKFVKRDKKPVAKLTLTPDEEKKFAEYYKQISTPYQHNETKQMLRWEKIKEKETELESKTKSATETLNKAIEKFNADVAEFKSEQAKSRGTPEQYDKFAEKRANEFEVLKAKIIQAENEGNLDEAKRLADEAAVAKRDSEQAKKFAETLRKNPPPDDKAIKEQFAKDQKTWIDKAAIDYPEFGKQDTALRKESVAYFQEMSKQHPLLAKLPGFIYFAVDYTAKKAASDRVPVLEKELGELRTKVKELEAATNPVPAGGITTTKASKSFENQSDDEQWESLHREAAAMR